ncbi:hypothetical protein ACA910_001459 [Epithemia clementina (nom. ined.)]
MESPAFANERILVHVNYDENDYGYTYYYNGQKFDNGTANPYYTPNCTDSTCRPAGCTDLWDCTLDTTNNQVYLVLLGSAIPYRLVSTMDGTYYNHYSIPATIKANWGLGNLGKKDVAASVLNLNPPAKIQDKWFDKYVLIVLENKDYMAVLNNSIFKNVANTGILLTKYHGVTHPSQPNYGAMIAGDHDFPGDIYAANTTDMVTLASDNGDASLDIHNQMTIADLLELAALTYRTYSKQYLTSGKCFMGDGFGYGNVMGPEDRLYRRKHNPFFSFVGYKDSHTRCAAQKDFDDFYDDLAAGTLADFSIVVPNQDNEQP